MSKQRTRAQKRAALASRKTLSPKNILEHVSVECQRAIHKAKSSSGSRSLRTNPALLKAAIYVPPATIKIEPDNPQQEN